jgi:hypothetical protein
MGDDPKVVAYYRGQTIELEYLSDEEWDRKTRGYVDMPGPPKYWRPFRDTIKEEKGHHFAVDIARTALKDEKHAENS